MIYINNVIENKHIYLGKGNFLQSEAISFRTLDIDLESEITQSIQAAIFFISGSFIPLVVIAGVPNLIPEGLKGGFGS